MKDDRLPIVTTTVARLCLAQGRLAQAEALFRHLLEKRPDDPQLSQGLAEVLRRRASERPAPTGDSVALEQEGELLRCHWSVSDEGHRRAQLVDQEHGQLVLRVLSFPQDQRPADTAVNDVVGSLTLTPPARASIVVAAVGLTDNKGGFVSIAHSPPLRLRPPGAADTPGAPSASLERSEASR